MTTHATWPAERFYWTVLDAPGWKHAGELPAGLVSVLEDDIPKSEGDLHAVCVPMPGGRLAVCAADRAALAELAPTTLALTPQAVPPFVECDPGLFNLLAGAFEPLPLRKARLRRHALAAATILLCGVLVAAGLYRRASRWDALATSARATSTQLAAAHSPTGKPDDLATEAARLRASREVIASTAQPPDAALVLAATLQAWPARVPSKPQSIAVGPTGVTISVSLEGDAAPFLRSFTPPAGWSLDEPRLNAADKLTRLTLHMRPAKEAP